MITTLLCASLLGATVQPDYPQPQDITSVSVEGGEVVVPLPVRTLKTVTVAGEVGWNGLAGTGLNVSWNLGPHFSLDSGLGVSGQTAKAGLRARWNLLTASATPFLGVGAMYGTGTPVELDNTYEGNTIRFKIDRSPFAQAVGGISYIADNGFSLLASAGASWLLTDNNILLKSGVPTANQDKGLRNAAGTGVGLVASLALGYSY
ncbi:MAG TPA: hypothetical protein VFH51_20890 [Myxococcota bacterium]|nr:hypothetical protein [Myxococcota bacterium]